ncbi:TraB/GumN family protein [Cupriavidus basilensis]|uniref:TraB/GumN family protein n=1 Tax=Cupriavidus basilensis TaxID=68895 RepID=A0ABT6ANQ9_9BURK|nr:TraB/GumN family protein [Cupriavidus basilensis]MDF3834028.1 TraB/GumN family protein [Cupriavidus basilensis]
MLWQIRNTEVSLLGSIHVLDAPLSALDPAAEQAYRAAARVVFEVALDQAPDSGPAYFPDGDQLSRHLPHAAFEQVRALWLGHGLPVAELERLRPVFAAMHLQFALAARHGILAEHGVDRYLWLRAAADGRLTDGLEDGNEALRMLQAVPLAEQVAMLMFFAGQPGLAAAEPADMVRWWRQGRAEPFAALLAQRRKQWPQTLAALVDARNRQWLPKILALAADRVPTLIVAGALHLVGETGLPALLAAAGFEVRPALSGVDA